MIVKAFEIRDKATFIPVIAIETIPADSQEEYLLNRAGFRKCLAVVLVRMECSGVDRNATYDPYAWGSRTYTVAHKYIEAHFHELQSGQVVDVEFILGETSMPKVSESES